MVLKDAYWENEGKIKENWKVITYVISAND